MTGPAPAGAYAATPCTAADLYAHRTVTPSTITAGAKFGTTSVSGDFNKDGYADVAVGLRDRFVKNPGDMRRYLSRPEMDAALKPKKGSLGRVNIGKAVERAAARHPDIRQHFAAVGGRDMPDFVALRTMRMYEVTTNSPSAFFNHVNRGYVDPTAYIGYKQVPFGTGLLPRLPQPSIIEPKFPFLPGAGP
ncbi:FG-GAP repeat protein [Streptosporangium pseudovulgare]|uniref:Uncharacterized protein n=1 Tax=Streptosporangium pseudovulgare TaxID=35765 RepID=A0ABQ2RCI1_9ACTN|nr:FG-GAP repeat protein [Streptosporangium pseudovulgare]GGQ22323.1 hypothetical protein GCM10010140_60780 [Streptosporangium pseudovulgare]